MIDKINLKKSPDVGLELIRLIVLFKPVFRIKSSGWKGMGL